MTSQDVGYAREKLSGSSIFCDLSIITGNDVSGLLGTRGFEMGAMTATIRSLRILRKNWKLGAIAILSLSVAMAIQVICLGISNTTLLIPPAGEKPNRLVTIYEQATGKGLDHSSYTDFEYYRDNNHVFAGVAALAEEITAGRMTYGSPSQTQKPLVVVTSNPVSENYFSVIGLKPFLGRLFEGGDKNPKSPIAVVTYSCWKRLGSDRDIV